jgi:phosphoglycerate dehydrogenase-like enzyme
MKIVVTHNLGLTAEQKARLNKLGEVVFFDSFPQTPDEWLTRIKGADIVISEEFGLKENLYNINNVFVSFPFVSMGDIEKDKLKERNVVLANAPGCNKNAVSEWVISMLINLLRRFSDHLNHKEVIPLITSGLKNKKVIILGKGNIGSKVGAICVDFDMKVDYFLRGDDLLPKSNGADIIINCLSLNKSTENMLDKTFFNSLKIGSFFITSSRQEIYDSEAMIEALSKGILAGVADDCASGRIADINYDYYKKISLIPNILATPHIAWSANASITDGNEIAIDNVEAYLNGKPINTL